MSIFHNNALVSSSGNQGGGGYEIERSLRFNSADSAHLSRTPGTAGNRKTWTWAGWVKRTTFGTEGGIFSTYAGVHPNTSLFWELDALKFHDYTGSYNIRLSTIEKFRDPSAWYHIVLAYNSTEGTASNRLKIWVNGTLQTVSGSVPVPLNHETDWNSATQHDIGRFAAYFDGYLADIHFIDGQALDPSSFGEFDTNGVWQPIDYAGTFGTNGFHLPFSDNSTAAALGTDTSGNGNTWTVNNISVTAGAGNDSLVDSPTNYGTDTGAGGEVRGNYCTLNPIVWKGGNFGAFSEGNLTFTTQVDEQSVGRQGTVAASSGKWYWELTVGQIGTGAFAAQYSAGVVIPGYQSGRNDGALLYRSSGSWYNEIGATTNYSGSGYVANDVIGFALDLDTQKFYVSKNGVWEGSADPATGTNPAASLAAGLTLTAGLADYLATSIYIYNFGQRPFAYTAPSGFKALCTTNLPEPVVAKPSDHFEVKLYTGTGSTQTISGLPFSPDLVWTKGRSIAELHLISDSVRGVPKNLYPNLTNAEDATNYLSALTSDGFTVQNQPINNSNGSTYVAWTWDAGSSTVTNTQGSITSQVRANASAGFSVVTYTGTGSIGTIGHGLGVAPEFIIVKGRTSTYNWPCYHASLGNTKRIHLNLTNAADVQNTWNNTSPTSSVFSVYAPWLEVNESGINFVAYCFAPVAGYSAFGSYTGNGSADGPFVYTGFRPRWVMIKRTDTTGDWYINDSARDTRNSYFRPLVPNTNAQEGVTSALYDSLSNGFKLRGTVGEVNGGSGIYIYAAFAEHPFATSRAR